MKYVVFILILLLLGAAAALSQIPNQPYHTLDVGSRIERDGIMEIGHPVAYSPDGGLLAVATHGGGYVYDTRALDEPRLLVEGHMLSVAFSQDGTMLAAGGLDKIVHLWDLQNEDHTELRGHEGSVVSVCFSPDNQVLASGGHDSSVRFWNVARKEKIDQLPLREDAIYSLAYRHDGSMLAIGAYNTIYLYGPEGQQILSAINRWDEGWPEMWILCMEFSPDGTILAAGSGDNKVDLWDVSELTRIERLRHNGDVRFVSFTPDGRQLAYGGWARIIHVYDMVTQETVSWDWEGIPMVKAGVPAIPSGAVSPDGRTLATASKSGMIAFWEMPGPVTAVQSLRRKSILWGMLKKMIGR
ncbi:WD40 repeat domain-containing protein [Candidatus Poribacteria bacterium]